jgi:hypothetical protein
MGPTHARPVQNGQYQPALDTATVLPSGEHEHAPCSYHLTSALFSLSMMSCRGPSTLTKVVRSSDKSVSLPRPEARTVAFLQPAQPKQTQHTHTSATLMELVWSARSHAALDHSLTCSFGGLPSCSICLTCAGYPETAASGTLTTITALACSVFSTPPANCLLPVRG